MDISAVATLAGVVAVVCASSVSIGMALDETASEETVAEAGAVGERGTVTNSGGGNGGSDGFLTVDLPGMPRCLL